jgi:PAS domain S-box-containing protein
MLLTPRNRFIVGATVGYVAFSAVWIVLTDQTVAILVDPTAQTWFATAKGLTFVTVTALLLFFALRAVPPEDIGLASSWAGAGWTWRRVLAALALPVAACVLQWTFWQQIQPYAWFLFFPAVFLSSWIGGAVAGLLATSLSTLLVWYIFIPVRFSFALENPFSIFSIGVFFAMGVVFSLTHQRLRQAERGIADTKFRALVDQSLAGIYIIQDGGFRYVNRAFAQMFGYPSPSDIVGRQPLEALVTAEHWVLVSENIGRCIDDPSSELRTGFPARRADGSALIVDIHGRSFRYEGRPAMIGIALDVSERVRAEQARRDSEQRLKLALAASRMGVWEWSVDSGAVYWSPECLHICGVTELGATLDAFTTRLHPEDADRVMSGIKTALTERTRLVAEFRIRRPGGEVRWVTNMADPIYGDDGRPLRLVGTISDVTERKRAEEELRRQANELRRQAEELRQRNEELERFNRASVGRELDMVGLKRQINALSSELGRQPPFALSFVKETAPESEAP